MVKPFGSALSSQQQLCATPTLLQDFPRYLNSLAWGRLLPSTQRTIAFCSSGLKPVQFSYSLVDFTHDSIELISHSLDTLLSHLWFSLFCTGCHTAVSSLICSGSTCYPQPQLLPLYIYLLKKIKLALGHHIICISKCKWQHLSSRSWKCTGGLMVPNQPITTVLCCIDFERCSSGFSVGF